MMSFVKSCVTWFVFVLDFWYFFRPSTFWNGLIWGQERLRMLSKGRNETNKKLSSLETEGENRRTREDENWSFIDFHWNVTWANRIFPVKFAILPKKTKKKKKNWFQLTTWSLRFLCVCLFSCLIPWKFWKLKPRRKELNSRTNPFPQRKIRNTEAKVRTRNSCQSRREKFSWTS